MNYIIIDTNIVYGDFFLESKAWKKLLHLNHYSECQVCVPEFVYNEIVKKYGDSIASIINAVKKVGNDASRYRIPGIEVNKLQKKKLVEAYSADFSKRLQAEEIEIIPYPQDNDYLERIAERYFNHQKPFDVNKLSFQDAIIWYSLIDFVEEKGTDDEFFFLTYNNKDFADKDDVNLLHEELLQELTDEQQEVIHLYNGLEEFFNHNEGLLDAYEEELEAQREEQIEQLQDEVKEYLSAITSFDTQQKLYDILLNQNMLVDYLESELLNTYFESDYGEGWGEDLQMDEDSLDITDVTVEFDEDLGGYVIFDFSVNADYAVVEKNPMYEDSDDEEFLYEYGHNSTFDLQLQVDFKVDDSLLEVEDLEAVDVEDYIQYSKPEIIGW